MYNVYVDQIYNVLHVKEELITFEPNIEHNTANLRISVLVSTENKKK